jgi:hypothetical protein
VGRWQGDTLVVDTMRVQRRELAGRARHAAQHRDARRGALPPPRDYGHLELTITVTDPQTFTKPITFSVVAELLPDTDLLEHYCLENERTTSGCRAAHGRAPFGRPDAQRTGGGSYAPPATDFTITP